MWGKMKEGPSPNKGGVEVKAHSMGMSWEHKPVGKKKVVGKVCVGKRVVVGATRPSRSP